MQEQNNILHIQVKQSKSDADRQRMEWTTEEASLVQRIEEARKDVEAHSSGLRTDVAVLREQNNALQAQLEQAKSDIEGCRKESIAKEAALLQRIDDGRKDVDREVHRGNDMKTHSDRAIAEARRQSAELQSHVVQLQTQLQAIPASCTVHEKEIENLKSQLTRKGSAYDALTDRSRSLNARYDQGDLVRKKSTTIIIQLTKRHQSGCGGKVSCQEDNGHYAGHA